MLFINKELRIESKNIKGKGKRETSLVGKNVEKYFYFRFFEIKNINKINNIIIFNLKRSKNYLKALKN